jgi:hypothetical protein
MSETHPGATYSKEKVRRGYSTLRAIDPHDGGEWDVLLPNDKMDWIARQGMGAARELADTVRWALLNPRHVYRGVRDDERDVDDDGWLCYVARPKHAYDRRTGEKRDPWPGEVLLVYVTDERVVYLWYWDECDEHDDTLPRYFEERFTERVF